MPGEIETFIENTIVLNGPNLLNLKTMETESVWDYPRPPRLEKTNNLIVVEFGGILIELSLIHI